MTKAINVSRRWYILSMRQDVMEWKEFKPWRKALVQILFYCVRATGLRLNHGTSLGFHVPHRIGFIIPAILEFGKRVRIKYV